ncbi:GTP-binding protein, partial [Acidianus sp. DSM 29099]|nr:GTP-binding protein [Acidianus sp. RZ1]
MLSPFERLRIPPKVEDLIKIELERIAKISGETPKDREIRRLKSYSDNIRKYQEFVK